MQKCYDFKTQKTHKELNWCRYILLNFNLYDVCIFAKGELSMYLHGYVILVSPFLWSKTNNNLGTGEAFQEKVYKKNFQQQYVCQRVIAKHSVKAVQLGHYLPLWKCCDNFNIPTAPEGGRETKGGTTPEINK